jgi:electron transfer flavoprotein alpha subunit
MPKHIWVFPELSGEEVNPVTPGRGLLSEAATIAARVVGTVTAISCGDEYHDFSKVLGEYGVGRACFFKDPLLKDFSAGAYAAVLLPEIKKEKPWLFLMGDTLIGRELAPRLAALLNAGLVTGCVKIDLTDPDRPAFYRPVYAGQLYQEVIIKGDGTTLVTLDTDVLSARAAVAPVDVETLIIEPGLPPGLVMTRHLAFLPAAFQDVDVADARTIVAAGMGAAADDLLAMIEELAALLEGSIGTTRPVVDAGKIPRERLIGQTGRVVGPDFYLALGISGASHHVGGIQDSKNIVAVNRDPAAPIFRNADAGVVADLREVLPALIKRIRQAKENGEVL